MEIKFGISGMLKPQKDNNKKEKSAGTKTSTLKRKWSLKLPKLDRKDNSNITNIETKTPSDKNDDNRFNNSNNKLDYEEEVVKADENGSNQKSINEELTRRLKNVRRREKRSQR